MDIGNPVKIEVEELIAEKMALYVFDSMGNTIYHLVVETIYDKLSTLRTW